MVTLSDLLHLHAPRRRANRTAKKQQFIKSGVDFTSPESYPPPLSKPETPSPRRAHQELFQNFFFSFEMTDLGSTGSIST
ncbi:hypothetical protein QTO34_003736 [Cnephaeus nilssonii]|uniref:Uncharacterized protein n=1 Tax=Cnephaeus nilssonii TaxID=3371016 RepID=A0AA40HR51_CNENI|nr:hypothetical protein QTO34_003736 [Eptesicus nilssonii]